MCDRDIELMAEINGIGFKHMTIYRAVLIHMKNDGLTAKDIARKLNAECKEVTVTASTVENWFTRGSQPKDEIIEVLETKMQERVFDMIVRLKKPELEKNCC